MPGCTGADRVCRCRRLTALAAASLLLLVPLAACSGTPSAGPASPEHRPTATTSSARPGDAITSSTSPTGPPAHLSVTRAPWSLRQPVGREAAVAVPGGIVVAGGLVAGDQSTAAAWQVDLHTATVTALPDLPVPVHDVGGALLQGDPMVFGGGNATEQDVVQRQTAGSRWRVVGHLPAARSDLVAARVGRRVVLIGGYNGSTQALADILASYDGRQFRVIGRLAVPVRYAAVAVADGGIWVFGGERSGAMVDVVQRINARTGRARVVAHLPAPLGHAAAVRLGQRILIAGGRPSSDTVTARLWWFDPGTRRFKPAGRLPYPLADTAVATTPVGTYLVGGETPGVTRRVLLVRLG
ncbi:MAG: Kelch repeat-containing protein [Nocardioidaceae bacterium]